MVSIAEANRVDLARRQVIDNKYSVAAWIVLLKDNQHKPIEQKREFFEELLLNFPLCSRFWRSYIECEIQTRNYEHAERLFRLCLDKVPSIDLWKLYISYVKDIHSQLTSKDKTIISQAYEYALKRVGMDVMSNTLWIEYITFLKSIEASGSYAENQKCAAIRKVYQQAIQTPLSNIELIWKDYCAFENGLNVTVAKKTIEELNKDYLNIRRASKELDNVTRSLDRNVVSIPPLRTLDERKQIAAWKKYINWEKNNSIRSEDEYLVTQRVMFAFEQCLLCYSHHMDIWYGCAEYLRSRGEENVYITDSMLRKRLLDETARIYESAITSTMKDTMLMYFAYADFEESRLNIDKSNEVYQRLLSSENINPTLCYILYMRFAQRTNGIKAFRDVFESARKDSRCAHQIYTAAAQIEYFCTKDLELAKSIIAVGLKRYSDNAEYVLDSIEFLKHIQGENDNVRRIYENATINLTQKALLPANNKSYGVRLNENIKQLLFNYVDFENYYGSSQSRSNCENMRSQAIDKLSDISGIDKMCALMVDRFRFLDLYPCALKELKMMGYQELCPERELLKIMKNAYSADGHDHWSYASPCPDVKQMNVFNPSFEPVTSLDTSRYNPFPFPQAAFNLLKRIPPVTSFQGPFVYLDQFMEICQNMKLPDKFHSSLAETFMNYKEPKPELSEIPFSPIKDETDESEDETIDD